MNPLEKVRNRVREKFLNRCVELRVQPGQAIPVKEMHQFPVYLPGVEFRVWSDVVNNLVSEGVFRRGATQHELILTEEGHQQMHPHGRMLGRRYANPRERLVGRR